MNTLKQSLDQLRLLGYKPGDKIYLRLIAGKGYDVQADRLYPFDGYLTLGERGYSFTRLNPASKGGGEKFTAMDGYRYLLKENLKGYGVYLVVNPGGRTDEDITECRSLFYECDGVSKEAQWERLGRLPFQPSLVIETRNSLHVYYRLNDPSVAGWRRLQQRLIQLMDSDRAIHNESRLMRLAGFYHMKKGSDPYPIAIVSSTVNVYSRAEFEEILPAWDDSRWSSCERTSEAERLARLEAAAARREANKSIDPLKSFPLEICLPKDDRDLITRGVSEGGRNTNGIKLAKNLIGTANYLDIAGYSYTGTARDLYDEYCDNCNPPIPDRERESIWRGAERGNPTPSLSDDAIENCIKAYQRRNDFSFTSYQPNQEEYQAYLARYEDEEISLKAYEAYLDKQSEESNKTKLCNVIKRFFSKRKKRKPTAPKGESRVYHYDPEVGLPEIDTWVEMGRPTFVYKAKDRDNVWLDALRKGYHYILDNSFMGSGKSYGVQGLSYGMRERDGEFKNLWYISNEHRNPSIQFIKDRFADLSPRNKYGFKYDEDGKLIKADKNDKDVAISGNCSLAELFNRLHDLGYNPNEKEDGQNPICKTCSQNTVCANVPGNYRADRRETFENEDRIRCALASLPREYNFSRDVFVVEEAGRQLTPTRIIEIDYRGLLMAGDRLRDILNPLAYAYIDGLIQRFKTLYENKEKYGLTTADILAQMPRFEYEDELIEALDASSIDLFEVFKESDRIDGLTQAERKQFKNVLDYARYELRKEAYLKSLANLETLPPNALIWLLKAIRGDGGISLRLGKKKKDNKIQKLLTLTIKDQWYTPVFAGAAGAIFLDATLSRNHLAYLLGIDPGEILVIREDIDKPLKNLTIHNIHIDGLKTSNPSPLAINRAKVALGALGPDVPKITHLKLLEALDADGYWWVHNRGSNDYVGREKLALVGIPCPNKGAIQDEYFALTGGLDGFDDYYQSLIKADLLQGIGGRQRCLRFPDKQFEAFLLADLTPTKDGNEIDLNFLKEHGAKIINEHGAAYHPEAGSVGQVTRFNILMAVRTLIDKGLKITQEALAKEVTRERRTGQEPIKQGRISQILKEAGMTITELIQLAQKNISFPIDMAYRETNNFLDDPDYRRWMGIDPLELIEEAISYITAVGWKDYRDLVLNGGIYPDWIRDKVIGWLTALMVIEPELFLDDGGGG